MLETLMFKKKWKSHNKNDLMDNLDMIIDYKCLLIRYFINNSFTLLLNILRLNPFLIDHHW